MDGSLYSNPIIILAIWVKYKPIKYKYFWIVLIYLDIIA
jgi:hypothetical protein